MPMLLLTPEHFCTKPLTATVFTDATSFTYPLSNWELLCTCLYTHVHSHKLYCYNFGGQSIQLKKFKTFLLALALL